MSVYPCIECVSTVGVRNSQASAVGLLGTQPSSFLCLCVSGRENEAW